VSATWSTLPPATASGQFPKERKQKEIKNKIGRKGEKAEAGEENRCGVGYLAGGWEE
jgi:hypothetical protein